MMATKILIKDGDRTLPFNWMDQKVWLNLKAFSKNRFNDEHNVFFKELPDRINRNESAWKQRTLESNEPKAAPISDYEEKINSDPKLGHLSIFILSVQRERVDLCWLQSNL
jgi:hypothetical protein